ncbi:unnamed protein product [Gordionus sp. m RMFG-2023]
MKNSILYGLPDDNDSKIENIVGNDFQRSTQYYFENFNSKPLFLALPLFGYISPVLILIILVTNTLIVLILLRKNMISPTNMLLAAMALADMLTALSPLPWFLYYYAAGNFKHPVGLTWCKIYDFSNLYLPTIFHTISVWLVLALAVHRYICVCRNMIGLQELKKDGIKLAPGKENFNDSSNEKLPIDTKSIKNSNAVHIGGTLSNLNGEDHAHIKNREDLKSINVISQKSGSIHNRYTDLAYSRKSSELPGITIMVSETNTSLTQDNVNMTKYFSRIHDQYIRIKETLLSIMIVKKDLYYTSNRDRIKCFFNYDRPHYYSSVTRYYWRSLSKICYIIVGITLLAVFYNIPRFLEREYLAVNVNWKLIKRLSTFLKFYNGSLQTLFNESHFTNVSYKYFRLQKVNYTHDDLVIEPIGHDNGKFPENITLLPLIMTNNKFYNDFNIVIPSHNILKVHTSGYMIGYIDEVGINPLINSLHANSIITLNKSMHVYKSIKNKYDTHCAYRYSNWLVGWKVLYFNFYFWFRVLFVHLVPCTVMVVLNAVLILTLKRTRYTLTNSQKKQHYMLLKSLKKKKSRFKIFDLTRKVKFKNEVKTNYKEFDENDQVLNNMQTKTTYLNTALMPSEVRSNMKGNRNIQIISKKPLDYSSKMTAGDSTFENEDDQVSAIIKHDENSKYNPKKDEDIIDSSDYIANLGSALPEKNLNLIAILRDKGSIAESKFDPSTKTAITSVNSFFDTAREKSVDAYGSINYINNMKAWRKMKQTKQTTSMLIVVVSLALVVEIPVGILFIFHILSQTFNLKFIDYNAIQVISCITDFSILASYPFNFVVYCLMSHNFRENFKLLFNKFKNRVGVYISSIFSTQRFRVCSKS